jgi:5S rRNA maturation endonuclease (ribonuclease M5)
MINNLSYLLLGKLDELLDDLDVNLNEGYNNFVGRCPIHDGFNNHAFYLNKSNHMYPGKFICYSHSCHETFMSSIIGFIRGVKSSQELNWREPGDEIYSFGDTLSYIYNFLKMSPKDIDKINVSKSNSAIPPPKSKPVGVPREIVRFSLDIPAQYYVKRGYSEKLLRYYDIGFCGSAGKYFYNRVVIPLYDATGKYMIGATGRSVFEECLLCGFHHDSAVKCPETPDEFISFAKWRHTPGFIRREYLFNYYENLPWIRANKCVILVESPGDALRLEDSGINGAVCMFGTVLSEGQKVLLDKASVKSIIVMTNNDAAGIKSAENIKKKYENSYRIYFPCLLNKQGDYGDLTNHEVTRNISPIIKGILKN